MYRFVLSINFVISRLRYPLDVEHHTGLDGGLCLSNGIIDELGTLSYSQLIEAQKKIESSITKDNCYMVNMIPKTPYVPRYV